MHYELKRFIRLQSVLALICLLAVSLLAIRIKLTHSLTYSFMIWNLFLALVPLFFAVLLKYIRFKYRITEVMLFTCWLLFFPNSTYMISDLLHLTHIQSNVPNWYDAIMLFVFAVSGLFVGVVSLRYVHEFLETKFRSKTVWLVLSASIVLGGLGVYLGRFLRWNSWDIINDPLKILNDIAVRVVHPVSHYETYFITAVFTAIVFCSYLLFMFLKDGDSRAVIDQNRVTPRNQETMR